MIGRLRGVLADIGEEEALIDVGGVGYVVRCGARTLSHLPPLGEEVMVHVETQTAEQTGTRLYGFLHKDERRAFVVLQTVQGVGPKAALGVLDVLSPGELAAACARGDKAAVGRANGVGPKLAQRIVTELKDKPIGDMSVAAFHAEVRAVGPVHEVTAAGDAVAALMGLGIAEPMARRTVEQAVLRLGDDSPAPALIKAALQELGR
jgi:Holliday junction DNA helicase RuvA